MEYLATYSGMCLQDTTCRRRTLLVWKARHRPSLVATNSTSTLSTISSNKALNPIR